MLPGHLVAEFWDKVREELRTREGYTAKDAEAAAAGFRQEAESFGPAGEMVYHMGPRDAAQAAAGWWREAVDRQADVPA